MNHSKFSFAKKGALLTAFFLSLGFCVQAQQPARPHGLPNPAQHEDITKNRPNDVREIPAPVKPVTETFYTPDGQLVKGPAPKNVTIVQREDSKLNATKHEESVPSKMKITRLEMQSMTPEKQQYVREHSEEFEITD